MIRQHVFEGFGTPSTYKRPDKLGSKSLIWLMFQTMDINSRQSWIRGQISESRETNHNSTQSMKRRDGVMGDTPLIKLKDAYYRDGQFEGFRIELASMKNLRIVEKMLRKNLSEYDAKL